MVAMALELEEYHVGQAVRCIPAVLEANGFCLSVAIHVTLELNVMSSGEGIEATQAETTSIRGQKAGAGSVGDRGLQRHR